MMYQLDFNDIILVHMLALTELQDLDFHWCAYLGLGLGFTIRVRACG